MMVHSEGKENVSKNSSRSSGYSMEYSISKGGTTREAGILINQPSPRNLLGKLTSSHIRQFVSPFYRQFEAIPSAHSKETQMRSGLHLAKTSNQKLKQIRRKIRKTKMKKSSTGGSSSNSKKPKIEEIMARVCTPTQNYLSKMFKEEMDETSDNKIKKSAIEYTKRVFHCELCKRRNME
ncbi:hypothetical protein JTB14_015474 [Gonioctena quinquepunctata]|nr:hypothetical protein JTB14_015474 [Gonioctena quinquepunctata]